MSRLLSNEGASKVLKLIGVNISNDSIKRLIDKISIVDNPNVDGIGINDATIRKRQTYATAVYDLNDHHLIALLDGRDKDTVVAWLLNHEKIKIALRNRASTYAVASSEVLLECIHVPERFHLFQNLIDKMNEIFKEELPYEIFIKGRGILNDLP